MPSLSPFGRNLSSGRPGHDITSRLDIGIVDPPPSLSSQPTSHPNRVWPSSSLPALLSKFRMQRTRTPTHGFSERNIDVESTFTSTSERPPIPSALATNNPQGAYSTPLPILSITVLSIVCHYPINPN